MLNELLIVERGARQAGIDMCERHPDVKDAGGKSTLIVQLDEQGRVECVRPVPPGVTAWTLRDGQHNSFPFVQPGFPLWVLPGGDEQRDRVLEKKKDGRRGELLSLSSKSRWNASAFSDWPGTGLLQRLRERGKQLGGLKKTDAALVRITIGRFFRACRLGSQRLLEGVANALIENLGQTAQEHWINIAVALLIGKKDRGRWKCDGALLFEAAGYPVCIADRRLVAPVSKALQTYGDDSAQDQKFGLCGLTGAKGKVLTGNFPQPKLPAGLGQTYLFSKNREIPANDRYGRFSAEAMPVGQETVMRLDGALRALTCDDRKNKTWRAIPGEAPKQNDLLLAFVDDAPDAPVAALLAENDVGEDFSEEESNSISDAAKSVAAFEKRTERLIESVQGRVTDLHKKVNLAILRKLDQANRKVVYASATTVADLYNAATTWVAGERNVPPSLTLPVLRKGEHKPRPMEPPHIAPLGLIAFSRKIFVRGGTEPQELVGLPTSETLRFFLDPTGDGDFSARRRAERVLRLVLTRRGTLVAGTAHALRRGFNSSKVYDRREALRTITLLGILLYKLDRDKEAYMNETAFKLGQLLAAADVVHAGYCADVRDGDVPPSLLGNQVFVMAQCAPLKALATLCRRWKPYDGWAKKAAHQPKRIEKLLLSEKKDERQRAWDVKKALRYAREMGPLAAELASALEGSRVDDTFRAELLLGYMAGFPKAQKEDIGVQDPSQTQED